LERVAKLLDTRPAAANDDARLAGMDRHGDQVGVPVDFDAANASVGQQPEHELAELDVLVQALGVVAAGEPLRLPVVDDANPEPVRMNLLSHGYASRSSSTTVMWLDLLRSEPTRPRARARNRFMVTPSPV